MGFNICLIGAEQKAIGVASPLGQYAVSPVLIVLLESFGRRRLADVKVLTFSLHILTSAERGRVKIIVASDCL